MSKLAIDGGEPNVKGALRPYNRIGAEEIDKAGTAMHWPLSGFLGGNERGGWWVRRLEDKWADTFGVKNAIACNSATSGLLVAAQAIDLGPFDRFICSAYTMSATAAAPMLTGARPIFCDVDPYTFTLCAGSIPRHAPTPKAVFLTHLFGLSIDEGWWKGWCDQNGCKLIVDAAQAPFARCDDVLAGTTGHIGVYSLNVHKHIQCGEGGICVTNDDDLAHRMRMCINHGEMAGGRIGLNLRMTEVTAAIALSQLEKADQIIAERIEKAEALIAAIGLDQLKPGALGLRPPHVHPTCKHVYYTVPFTIEKDRSWFVKALAAEGVPLVEGYVAPLYRLPAFHACYAGPCPVAEDLHDRALFYYENCAYDPTPQQIRQIGDAFQKVAEHAQLRP